MFKSTRIANKDVSVRIEKKLQNVHGTPFTRLLQQHNNNDNWKEKQ